MVHGSHVIISAYGFWLPNDPRGSWSDFVRAWELFRFGDATKVETRESVASKAHDCELRKAAKDALKYPAVSFSGFQAKAIGNGIGDYAKKSNLAIWACAILPEHMHLVIGRHRYKVETVVNLIKGAATKALKEQGLHPLAEYKTKKGGVPQCFGRGEWKVFLGSDAAIRRAITYTEKNPEKEGKQRQNWSFVSEYLGLGW